jgi:hypothetical protein
MPPTTGFRSGNEFRAIVQNSLAAQDKDGAGRIPKNPMRRVGLNAGWAAALARRPDFGWRRRLAEEIASLRAAAGSLAGRLRPATSAETRAVDEKIDLAAAVARAEAELRARRSQARDAEIEAQRREIEAVQARLGRGQPEQAPELPPPPRAKRWTSIFRKVAPDARNSPAGAPESQAAPVVREDEWAGRLAEEYHREFHPVAAARTFAPQHAEEKPTAADGAAAAAFVAGKLIWRASLFLRPLFRFALAHSAPVVKIAAVGLVILAGAGFLAQWPRPAAESPVAETGAGARPTLRRPTWVKIAEPFHLYDLPSSFIAGEKLDYEARRRSIGGGREDFLTFGTFSGAGPFVRLGVYRHGSEKWATPPFYVDMARRAAAIEISIDRADPPTAQATRFGDFETAAMTMIKGRQARDNCRGFRFSVTPPGLAIAGFACGADDQPFSGGELACLINRLDLVSAGDDRLLSDFFAAAQSRHSQGCPEPEPPRRRRR